MERIRNLISPRARRKKLDLGVGTDGTTLAPTPKIFGVSLHDLMLREPPTATVPHVVVKICEYIYKFGLDHVGLFRVSGSVRVVEKMRMQFDLTGDVNLEEENDVAATAGLLKVFLRDLPETVIPESLTNRFFSVVKDKLKTVDKLEMMKNMLRLLPEEHFNLLKYVCSLLVVVAANEEENKMSAFTLAILFGPNIFTYKVTSGLEGMKDMDTSKDVMQLFISHYNFLFSEDGEPSPKEFWDKSQDKKKTPPSRPPPPKITTVSPAPSSDSVTSSTTVSPTHNDHRPVPSPRKIKNVVESHPSITSSSSSKSVEEAEEEETKLFLPLHSHIDSVPLFSPRDEVEHSRSHSPFALESDTHSIIDSPMVTARTSEFVEKTIVETISEHIFGVFDVNQNSECQSPKSPPWLSHNDTGSSREGTPVDTPVIKPRTSLANRSKPAPLSTSSTSSRENIYDNDSLHDFDELQSSSLLTGVKKHQGPPRRSPSLKHRHSWEGSSVDSPSPQYYNNNDSNIFFQDIPTSSFAFREADDRRNGNSLDTVDGQSEIRKKKREEEMDVDVDNKNVLVIHDVGEDGRENKDVDLYIVEKKVESRRSYADVVNGWTTPNENENNSGSPHRLKAGSPTFGDVDSPKGESSPTTALTLLIPPLDLTTLHQQVDGGDARPVSNEQVSSTTWINKADYLTSPGDHNTPVVSPRSSKMKKRNGPLLQMPAAVIECGTGVIEAPMSPSAYSGPVPLSVSSNTDIPPSPPIHQDLYKKHSDDECSHRLRQLTKKIQGLKKRIKAFEESFEKVHGYRPSQGERAAQPEIKKFMIELSKARKDLKQLKEQTEKTNRSRHNSGASSSGMEMSPPVIPNVASTLEVIMQGLKEKRQEVGRPEEIMLMTREQIQQEKLDVQKALLKFEGLHGRPSTKEEKDLMRPLYDRYRQIKRTLAKPISPRNSLELQTVPEEHIMEIPRTFNRAPIHVPTAFQEEDNNEIDSPDLGSADPFGIVTRDFSRLGVVKDHVVLHDIDLPPHREYDDEMDEVEAEQHRERERESNKGDAHLHELSLSELHEEIETTRKEKKKLRKILREFEEDFLIQHGRKVQKEDRHPLQIEYSDYKKVKARMRLLEALVLKHHE